MIQIYFHENQNKLQAIASGFVVISQLNLDLYLDLENRVKFLRKTFSKHRKKRGSYRAIFADLCRAVGVKVVQYILRAIFGPCACAIFARKFGIYRNSSKLFGMR